VVWMIIGPTAVGKTTLANTLFTRGYSLLVSYTTRQRRRGEVPGKDYFFITVDKFKEMVANGEFVEHTQYNGHYYGIARSDLERVLTRKKSIIVVVDGFGFLKLKQKYDYRAVFLLPPSKAELKRRMLERGDSEEFAKERLNKLESELEFSFMTNYLLAPDTPSNLADILSFLMDTLQSAYNEAK